GTVADVIFTPPAGSYSSAQSVVLTTTTEGAYFRYTTDGSEPTNASMLYTTAISVPLNTVMTIKAKAYKTGWNPSNTGTAVYNVTGQVAWIPPIFNPAGGNYASDQMVSISIPNPADAVIHYTTDGSVPSSTNGMLYAGPISITQTTNLQAIAFKLGWTDSVVASAQYNFGVSAPVFNPPAGTYQSAQNIAITSSTPGAVIRYTLDGSDPTSSNGIIYSAPIFLGEDTNTIIRAKAFKGGWADSPLAIANYIISGTVANVVFNPMGGIFQEPVSVVLTSATPGAVIRYTLDGSEPNAGSTQYTTAITVPLNSTWTIRAKAFRAGWISSATLSQTYTVTGQVVISAPVFSVVAGTYTSARTVSINTPIPADATIRFTTDGSDPNASSPVYSAPITVPLNSTMTIKAMAFRSNWIPSPIYSATYVITGQVALPVPMFTPPAGIYQTAQSVTLNTATIPSGAVLRYTLDGSEPNQGSPAYQNPISLAMNSTTTIKVKGFSPDWIASPTLEATYVITGQVVFNTPVFNPAPGIYTAAQMITINSTMPADATIRYTLDGSEPNAASPVYSSAIPLPLNSTLTIKVKAFKANWTASETHTGFYTTTGAVSIQLPVFTPAPGLFTTPQNIVLNTNTIPSGATLRYTLDGSDPNESSAIYSTPIPVNSGQTVTIRVRAYTANWLPSQIHTGVFTVTGQVAIVAPVFSPVAGTYQTAQTVAINTTTTPAGATIRYTMDGSEPTASSPVYMTPINLALNTNTTIKAKAYLDNWVASETYTAVYVITGTVAINAPVFTPAAGTYQSAQSVTINTLTTPAGATIRYTTDGSDPTATSPVYSAPISVPLNTMMTIKARAFLTGWTSSQVYSSVYNVTGQIVLPTPMFTPPAGTYQTQQSVSLNTNTTPTGSTLRYTLNGTVPTESSPAYAAGNPIALPMSAVTTITVRAFKADWTPSNSVSATYNVTGQVSFPAIVFSPPQGTYTSPQSIAISAPIPATATIRYTLDGSEPTVTSSIYSAPINLAQNTNTTIKVKGFLTDWTPSVTHTAVYTITGEVSINTPVFNPAPGIYTTAQSVSINTTTAPAGAIVRYTTDGTDPTATSPIYTAPISIPLNSTMQIKARAYATNWLASPIYTGNYTVTGTASIPDPVFTPPAGTYSTAQTLVLNTNTMPLGATLRYSLDGSEPTETHPQYSLPILLQGPAVITVKVKAFAANWIASQTYTAVYNMTGQVTLMQPLFNPAPGVYTSAQSVNAIAQPNPSSAVIRYTVDGSDPSASSPIFTDPIQIPLNTAMYEIRIRGFLAGWDPSTVASGIYTITGQVILPAQPFTPAPGTYTTAQTISIAAPILPVGATLRYTLDGSEPTADSPAYTVPLQIPQNTMQTIKIKGFVTDWIPSETITAVYNITGTVAAPVMSIPGGLYSNELHLELSSATAGATIRYTTDGSDPDQSSALYTDPIVIPEQAQDFVVKAKAFKTDWISSTISTQTYSVLLIPIDVRAFSYGGYIRVLWNSPIAAKVLNGFNIYRRRTSEASFTKLNATPILNQLGADYYYDDYEISVNTSYQYYVTAIYNGVESLPSMTTTIEYQSQDLQISDASYAYPNPATSSTKIKLVLSRNDNVQVAVSIYDFAGKKVKTLTVPPTNSNLIEILWDLNNTSGKKVGRGTYFARITANDGVNTSQKVIKISVK
ncbi:MAG: chitobiase/beta-hexosaminidase C-terminal domain-containing protein, partial [Candidatus Cloacimonadaceae bacterium]|nr:chitobiase/beta-hexosaminidase C-terminal domain-containing protein [Candidatus Cloacimonadaceae bacterium]